MGQSTVLQLKCCLTNRKQHEENYRTKAKASECSGRGNHNNDSALPLAAIRVDKQEGHILIGSSFGLRGKLCQVKYACGGRVRNVMQSASDGPPVCYVMLQK